MFHLGIDVSKEKLDLSLTKDSKVIEELVVKNEDKIIPALTQEAQQILVNESGIILIKNVGRGLPALSPYPSFPHFSDKIPLNK
jgi:hypothetical protein